VVKDSVLGKLSFARKRLDEICLLVSSNTISVNPNLRQQLAQEYFFHLLGAAEYLAQLINKERNLGLEVSDVALHKVTHRLKEVASNDPLIPIFDSLNVNTKKEPFPTHPFSDKGHVSRLVNYRNEVVHRNTNPYHFSFSADSGFAEFWLDPRDHSLGKTGLCVDIDLKNMYDVIEKKIKAALQHV
jgi:hypothetical protein